MKDIRTALIATLVTFALACAAPPASAQAYPNKPVRVIVQYPPGGTPDIYGRIMSAELGKLWNQSVVVENRTGASGTIGTELVDKAAPEEFAAQIKADHATWGRLIKASGVKLD